MTPWMDYWIFLGLALCCLYIPYFLIRGEGARLLAGCVSCMAVIQAYILFGLVPGPAGWLLYLHQWLLYPVAPLLYLYFSFLLGEPYPAIRVLRHLSPTLLVVAVTGLEWLIPAWRSAGLQAVYQEQVYRRYDLTLPLLAEMIGLTPHQLSELINTHLGMNFTRLVKMHRVREARELLVSRPSTSALDIGLSVGFTSLSAFYAAFRELEGMAPGQFRKQAKSSATD